MLPVAHVGHWAMWVLYAAPLLIVLVSIAFSLGRHRDDHPGEEAPEGEREAEAVKSDEVTAGTR